MKEKYDHRLLLKHLPSDLRVFLEHIQVTFDIYGNYTTNLYLYLCNNKTHLYTFVEFGVCR